MQRAVVLLPGILQCVRHQEILQRVLDCRPVKLVQLWFIKVNFGAGTDADGLGALGTIEAELSQSCTAQACTCEELSAMQRSVHGVDKEESYCELAKDSRHFGKPPQIPATAPSFGFIPNRRKLIRTP